MSSYSKGRETKTAKYRSSKYLSKNGGKIKPCTGIQPHGFHDWFTNWRTTGWRRNGVKEEKKPVNKGPVEPLEIKEVDLLKENNKVDHITSEYEDSGLILRRGWKAKMKIAFSRKFDPEHDKVVLHFIFENATPSKNALVRKLEVRDHLTERAGVGIEWGAMRTATEETEMTVVYISATDSPVGEYFLLVETTTTSKVDGEEEKFEDREMADEDPIRMLFNPFCEGDDCYMENEAERNEYVLNEDGLLFCSNRWCPKPWRYAHFHHPALDVSMYLLDESKLKPSDRGDPIRVTRCISQLVNSNDDNGILVGNWSGNYEDGSSPCKWIGSESILSEYMCTKLDEYGEENITFTPVRFGQCWVFSGLVVTVLRALGIPVRSVTNYSSAHDTDNSMTIDKYYDCEGNQLDSQDSIWNFHVWNEAWFKRPDLPDGAYDGWQVIDATPQEPSKAINAKKTYMMCGPASVKAIYNGEIYLPYDTAFICAEVRSIIARIHLDEQNDPERIDFDWEACVGRNISTKKVGDITNSSKARWEWREDLTQAYKNKDDKLAIKRALGYTEAYAARGKFAAAIDKHNPPAMVKHNLDLPDNIHFNSDLKGKVELENTTDEPLTLKINTDVMVTSCTGKIRRGSHHVLKEDITLQPRQTASHKIFAPAACYINHVTGQTALKVVCSYRACSQTEKNENGKPLVKETCVIEETVDFQELELTVITPKDITLEKEFELKVSFTNPLDREITGELRFEGTGLEPRLGCFKDQSIPPHTLYEIVLTFEQRKPRVRFVATFDFDNLPDATCDLTLFAKKCQEQDAA